MRGSIRCVRRIGLRESQGPRVLRRWAGPCRPQITVHDPPPDREAAPLQIRRTRNPRPHRQTLRRDHQALVPGPKRPPVRPLWLSPRQGPLRRHSRGRAQADRVGPALIASLSGPPLLCCQKRGRRLVRAIGGGRRHLHKVSNRGHKGLRQGIVASDPTRTPHTQRGMPLFSPCGSLGALRQVPGSSASFKSASALWA